VRQFVKAESLVIALAHVRVIDGTGSLVGENQTIVIAGDKIQAIGDSTAMTIQRGKGSRIIGLYRDSRFGGNARSHVLPAAH
jgi:hypothetical protein